MQLPAKTFIVTLVSAVTFAFSAAPAVAAPQPTEDFSASAAAAIVPAAGVSQTLNTTDSALATDTLDTMMQASDLGNTAHGFDVAKTIELAESEIGTSRATGWSQPGECIMSAQRWIWAGGGAWKGGGDPVTNYDGAIRLTVADALPGDIIQYENLESPNSWVTGVHTLLVTGVNDDGTFTIIQSNDPAGSGLVTKEENWTPKTPDGFQAVVWRF